MNSSRRNNDCGRDSDEDRIREEKRVRYHKNSRREKGWKRSAFGGGPAVDNCDEQQNVDRNYAVINLETYTYAHTYICIRGSIHIGGVGRLHRWLGIFVFSGWHRPAFTRLHAPLGCVICMFAVTEENLNQPPPLYKRPPPLRALPPFVDTKFWQTVPKINQLSVILSLSILGTINNVKYGSDMHYVNPFAC